MVNKHAWHPPKSSYRDTRLHVNPSPPAAACRTYISISASWNDPAPTLYRRLMGCTYSTPSYWTLLNQFSINPYSNTTLPRPLTYLLSPPLTPTLSAPTVDSLVLPVFSIFYLYLTQPLLINSRTAICRISLLYNRITVSVGDPTMHCSLIVWIWPLRAWRWLRRVKSCSPSYAI
jgi:hypothetical protein